MRDLQEGLAWNEVEACAELRGFYVYCAVYRMCMHFRVRNRHSIRDVSRFVGEKRSPARELASLDVRRKESNF